MTSILIAISVVVASLFFPTVKSDDVQPDRIARHVIIIGVDGLSPAGIRDAEAPTLQRFIAEGAYSFHARTVLPSNSGPNWASILNGGTVEQHGVFINQWTPENAVMPPVSYHEENLFPSIFAAIRHQMPDAKTGAIFDWHSLENFVENDLLDILYLADDELNATNGAIRYLTEHRPDFAFIHLDPVDAALHRFGYGSPEYQAAVERADSLIGGIYDALQDAGMADDSVIMITADHGGLGYGHGGTSPQEMQVPFIVYGRGAKQNHVLRQPINNFDVPATALFALGLDVPFEWTGRPVKAAFEGFDPPKLMFNLNHLLDEPIILPGRDAFNPAGGLFINEPAVMEIINTAGRGDVRYTVDGSVPQPTSSLYTEPVTFDRNSVVRARIFEGTNPISVINNAYFRVLTDPANHGLNYSVYEKDDIRRLPDFSNLEPTAHGRTLEISTNDLALSRDNFVAAVLEGHIRIDDPGVYRFSIASDDGSKLYINGAELVDNDGDHGVIERSGAIELDAGFHEIRVEWFNAGGGYWLGAFYEGPGIPKQIVPPNVLYPEM